MTGERSAADKDKAAPDGFGPVEAESPYSSLIGPVYENAAAMSRGFRVEAKHINNAGIAHGGMLMSIADMTLARGVRDANGGPGVTVRMVSDFHGPARLGDWVEGHAKVTRMTRTMVFVSAEIVASGRLIMTATGIFRRLRPRASRTVPVD
tara:strand:- start:60 stop:512 length:453 start_codon:yes stop_codon:yes gene_type:complete